MSKTPLFYFVDVVTGSSRLIGSACETGAGVGSVSKGPGHYSIVCSQNYSPFLRLCAWGSNCSGVPADVSSIPRSFAHRDILRSPTSQADEASAKDS